MGRETRGWLRHPGVHVVLALLTSWPANIFAADPSEEDELARDSPIAQDHNATSAQGQEEAPRKQAEHTELSPVIVRGGVAEGLASFNPFGLGDTERPLTLRSFDADALRQSGRQRINEIADIIPGATSTDSGDGNQNDSLEIRGFTADFIAVNGLRRFSVNETWEPFEAIERIEVISGGSGIEAGGIQPGGAVNLVTKKPSFRPSAHTSLAVGSFEERSVELDLTGPLPGSQELAYRFIAFGERADSFRDNFRSDRLLIAPSLSWRYAPGAELLLETSYYCANTPYDRGVIYVEGAGFPDNFTPREVSFHRADDFVINTRWRTAAYLTQPLTNALELRGSLEWINRDVRGRFFDTFPTDVYENVDPASGRPLRPFTLTSHVDNQRVPASESLLDFDGLRNQSAQIELVGEHDLGSTRHQWLLGGLLQRGDTGRELAFTERFQVTRLDDLSDVSFFEGSGQVDFNQRTRNRLDIASTFAQYRISHGPWSALAGWRYDWTDTTARRRTAANRQTGELGPERVQRLRDNNDGWRLGAMWQALPELVLHASGARSSTPQAGSFRTGTVEPSLTAETLEFGIRGRLLNDRIDYSVVVYQGTQSDVLEIDPSRVPGTSGRRLIGELRSEGAEALITASLPAEIQLEAGYALTSARLRRDEADLQGNRRFNIPRHSGHLRISGPSPNPLSASQPIQLSALTVYEGDRPGNDRNEFTLPAYIRIDLQADLPLPAEGWNVGLLVQNLLDREYIAYSLNTPFWNHPGTARAVRLSVSRDWR